MSLLEMKLKYNALLKREAAGADYLEDKTKPYQERMRWLYEYKAIVDKLNKLADEIEAAGCKMTVEQILGGFTQEDLEGR